MKLRASAIAWFVTGAFAGFGGLALAFGSLGVIALLPALVIGVTLLVLRIPAASMFLVGAGAGISIPWVLHIMSGDTPDSQLWPVFVGLAFVAAGFLLLLRPRPGLDQAPPRKAPSA